MKAGASPEADRDQIRRFVEALFRYAEEGGYVSLRSFYDDANQVFEIRAVRLSDDADALVEAAVTCATQAARAGRPVVFAPPIATFANPDGAAQSDLQNGLCLSVECDKNPEAARQRLEQLLGPATIVVASGGEWPDPDTGVLEPKLHLHWRLSEPTTDQAGHDTLKRCRAMAKDLVGGDPTSNPMVHPMRWPGSWHRKSSPRLARILAETDQELDLSDTEQRLQDAWDVFNAARQATGSSQQERPSEGEARGSGELIRAILSGADYHAPIVALAMRYLKGGMADAQAVLTLQGIMMGVPDAVRDIKDGVVHPLRWLARYNDISRAVSTARAEIEAEKAKAASDDVFGRDRIGDFRLDVMTTGTPPAQQFLLAPLMPLGKVGLLFGAGGIGKSLVALALSLAVSIRSKQGEAVFGGLNILGSMVPAEAAGASVFLTLEDDTAEIHRRIASLDPQGGRDGAPCFVIPGVDLMNFDPALVIPEGRLAALTAFAKDGLGQLLTNVAQKAGHGVRLLVLDPAGDFMNADENDATFVKVLMRHLRMIAAKHGCSIILIGHVAKGVDVDNPTMRGSSAWIANSRFAYALWKPDQNEAQRLAREVGDAPENLIWGSLVKANHAGAPIGSKRIFSRTGSGLLADRTSRLASHAPREEQLLQLLAEACGECAAAGLPFTVTGTAGLYTGRADLPEPLSSMSKHPLEALGNKALDEGLLVKARTAHTQASPKFLDVPNGPLATGEEVEMFHGSRQEALARHRAQATD